MARGCAVAPDPRHADGDLRAEPHAQPGRPGEHVCCQPGCGRTGSRPDPGPPRPCRPQGGTSLRSSPCRPPARRVAPGIDPKSPSLPLTPTVSFPCPEDTGAGSFPPLSFRPLGARFSLRLAFRTQNPPAFLTRSSSLVCPAQDQLPGAEPSRRVPSQEGPTPHIPSQEGPIPHIPSQEGPTPGGSHPTHPFSGGSHPAHPFSGGSHPAQPFPGGSHARRIPPRTTPPVLLPRVPLPARCRSVPPAAFLPAVALSHLTPRVTAPSPRCPCCRVTAALYPYLMVSWLTWCLSFPTCKAILTLADTDGWS